MREFNSALTICLIWDFNVAFLPWMVLWNHNLVKIAKGVLYGRHCLIISDHCKNHSYNLTNSATECGQSHTYQHLSKHLLLTCGTTSCSACLILIKSFFFLARCPSIGWSWNMYTSITPYMWFYGFLLLCNSCLKETKIVDMFSFYHECYLYLLSYWPKMTLRELFITESEYHYMLNASDNTLWLGKRPISSFWQVM